MYFVILFNRYYFCLKCEKIINTVIEKYHGLDILINNAGIYKENAIENVSEAELMKL